MSRADVVDHLDYLENLIDATDKDYVEQLIDKGHYGEYALAILLHPDDNVRYHKSFDKIFTIYQKVYCKS